MDRELNERQKKIVILLSAAIELALENGIKAHDIGGLVGDALMRLIQPPATTLDPMKAISVSLSLPPVP